MHCEIILKCKRRFWGLEKVACFRYIEKIGQGRRTKTREKVEGKEWTEYYIHKWAENSHNTFRAGLCSRCFWCFPSHLLCPPLISGLALGVGWVIVPWELRFTLTVPHLNQQQPLFTFYLRTFSDHWSQVGQQASTAYTYGRDNTPWQPLTNKPSLRPCWWTFWETPSLPLKCLTGIQPQSTMIFITHPLMVFSSAFISLFPPLPLCFLGLLPNELSFPGSLTLSQSLPWEEPSQTGKWKKEGSKLIDQHSLGRLLAILSGTQAVDKIP